MNQLKQVIFLRAESMSPVGVYRLEGQDAEANQVKPPSK